MIKMRVQGEKIGLYLSGQPIKIPSWNIFITQPKVKDVVLYGEDNFLINSNILGHTENVTNQMREGNSQLNSFNDFQLLLIILNEEAQMKNRILDFLSFICPDYEINVTESSIDFSIIQEDQEMTVGQLNPFNFEDLQNTINDLFEPKTNKNEIEYNPANEKAVEIAKKIQEGRARKNKQISEKEGESSMFGRFTSILSIGMQMDINIFFNYTPFQLYDAFQRYFDKVNSDVYTKISTTPLMDVSKVQTPKE